MSGQSAFSTVTVTGGLLPGGLLERVDRDDSGLEASGPTDYHLASGERIRDAITQSWNRLLPLWQRFAPNLDAPERGAQTGPTRQEWLLPLFDELGYGHLAAAPAFEVEGKRYPISHVFDSVPIHLVGVGVEIDRRAAGVAGAATASPHGLMQEFLNRSSEHLWGITTNGRRLRLLRDNASLTRVAYAEFDLAEMFDGEVFSDFALLWLTCHASRLEGPAGKQVIERWRDDASKLGVRALDALRQGVETAIETLGSAAVGHPANRALRLRLEDRTLDRQDLYRQLLRVVYRVLFLLVAESRHLLTDPNAPAAARDRYVRYYSITRIREMAETIRGGTHTDLWQQLGVVARSLETEGEPVLGLLPLGGFLWNSDSTKDLNELTIPNEAVLTAVRSLTMVKPDKQLMQRVDYANLGAEELGSIYESLLEYIPQVNPVNGEFSLIGAAGNERKTTGSYYTPTSLIEELLNSALDPVLTEAATKPDPEQAVLALKVVDPAAGSGHFLIAAAHRIANRLARIRAGEDEPSPGQLRTALRDVIGHCIYAVDINPMAVELAKVALWMEAMEPGKPLTFLDHHIVPGNSLLGVTPKLLEQGIPDDAYKSLTGDDKEVVKALRARNKKEREKRLVTLNFGDTPTDLLRQAAAELAAIDLLDDSTVAGIAAKQGRFEQLVTSAEQQRLTLAADAWVAAFVGTKTKDAAQITSSIVNAALHDPESIPQELAHHVGQIAVEHKFHHWHLVFPDVFATGDSADERTGWTGGFDVVLGNPPWERVKLQEKEFFATVAPEIATAPNKAARDRLIKCLIDEQPSLWDSFQTAVHQAEALSHFLRTSGVYPLCGRGDVNTYTVFAEAMRSIVGPTGRAGVIVPTGIATDHTTKDFFADMVDHQALVNLFGFYDRKQIFQGADVHGFCLLTMSGPSVRTPAPEFVFFARSIAEMHDPERRFSLSAEGIALLNPNTHTVPLLRTAADARLATSIARRVPILANERNPRSDEWGLTYKEVVHLTHQSAELHTSAISQDSARVYEAKMVHHFDHRWATYGATNGTQPIASREPDCQAMPRYWVTARHARRQLGETSDERWQVVWRDIARSTDERTLITTVIPHAAPANTLPMAVVKAPHAWVLVIMMSSFAVDYTVRLRVGGTHLTMNYLRQINVPPTGIVDASCPWDRNRTFLNFLAPRGAELWCTADDMMPLASDLGFGPVSFRWDADRRSRIRAELDAALFHLFGLSRAEVDYIMDTFPVVKRRDIAEHASYRTKELIIDVYDRMAKAIETGEPYQTILDPPPADPSLCHPPAKGAL